MFPQRKPVIGDCDCCDAVQTEVWMSTRNMLQCAKCKEADEAAEARSKTAQQIIDTSRQIDYTVKIKQDIFLSKPIPMVELRAAIDADDSIPAANKDYVYAKECQARAEKLQQIIFEDREALRAKETEWRMWITNGQSAAGKVRAEQRAEFKNLDINYVPAPITKKQKTVKPVKQAKRKFDKTAIYEAAKKYKVSAAQVEMILIGHNDWTPEQAAKHFAELMGLL